MGTAKGRGCAILLATAALAVAPAVLGSANAQAAPPQLYGATAPLGTYDDVSGAQLLASQINGERTARGLRALTIDVELTDIAQAHSRRMAAAGEIWHNDDLFTDSTRSRIGASALGENVGFDGGGATTTHQMYMDSPAHRANILDPRFTAMGIAVTVADGIAYSTEDFMQAAPPPPPPPAPKPTPPAAAPPTAPPTTEPVAAQATTPSPAKTVVGVDDAPTVALADRSRASKPRSATGAPRVITQVATSAPVASVPTWLASLLGLVNAGLAWASVLVRRRIRRAPA